MAEVPLCDFCPLTRSCGSLGPFALAQLREKAAEIYYGNLNLEISDIDEWLVDDYGADPDDAELAVDCLNRVYRNNCPTGTIGHLGGNAIGIIARED